MSPRQRLWNCVVALDAVAATWFGAWPDETLSSFAYRLDRMGDPDGRYWRKQIDDIWYALFQVEDHCRKSYDSHMRRNAIPPEHRTFDGQGKSNGRSRLRDVPETLGQHVEASDEQHEVC